MALWVFGDSFSSAEEGNWIDIVAKELIVDVNNLSVSGCANEFIQTQIKDNIDKITSEDYVIVCTTQQDRRWFFPFRPDTGVIGHKQYAPEGITKEQFKAVQQYYLHLNTFESNKSFLDTFVGWINWTTFTRNLNVLIIPGFEISEEMKTTKYAVWGNLFHVTCQEFGGQEEWEKFLRKHKGHDPRVNHLSPFNHKILAKKVINCFQNKERLDLTVDFNTPDYDK